ncbi:unnamed protein product [Arabidopsis lyrata]|nr:unnamed protein product [Arabidopsis lyrata]
MKRNGSPPVLLQRAIGKIEVKKFQNSFEKSNELEKSLEVSSGGFSALFALFALLLDASFRFEA